MSEDPTFEPQAAGAPMGLRVVPLGTAFPGGPPPHELRRFNGWLFAAFLVHSAVLTGFISAKPRQIGDASGLDGAISISLVTEADLRGDATVADQAPGSPSPAAPSMTPPAPPAVMEPPAQPPSPSEEPTEKQRAAEQPAPPEPVLKPAITPDTAKPERDTADAATLGEGDPQSAKAELEPPAKAAEKEPQPQPETPPHETKPPDAKPHEENAHEEKPHEAKPAPKPAKPAKPKETKSAKLDLAMPPAMQAAPPGSRGAGVERPAGITRSGENDAFARNVIRALQQTMPQLRDTRGRVKVRITLDKNGNLVSTQVMMPSNVAGLDQSVVFATRQTSFPLPPYKAVPADLVFVVTYIYK
jgi:TonB family protein